MILATLAVTVALVVLFCIAAAAFLVGQPFFEEHRQHMAMVLGGSGVLFLLAGCWLAGRRAGKSKDTGNGIVIFDLRYWGPMLVLFGGITLFIHTLDLTGLPRQLRAMLGQEKVMVAAREPDQTNAPAPPVVFPVLKLQGLIFKQNQPVVIIRGQSYGIGESIDGILIKNITREGVTLELSNEVKLLSFGGAATPGMAVTPAGK